MPVFYQEQRSVIWVNFELLRKADCPVEEQGTAELNLSYKDRFESAISE